MTKSTTKKKNFVTVYKQILKDTKLRTGKRGQKTSRLGELHYGGEDPHWTVVPSREEEEEEKEEEEKGRMRRSRRRSRRKGGGGEDEE